MDSNIETQIRDYNIATYRSLRRAIGYMGILLPIVLVALSFIPFFETPVQASISHYYYTNLREIFTGTLCGVGLFLIRYKGYPNKSLLKNDGFLTNVAGFMAFGVALVPTNPEQAAQKVYTIIPSSEPLLGWLHYSFAALLFLVFSILAIKVFTIGQANNPDIPISLINENRIYRLCGYSIIVFIALVPISRRLHLFPYSTLLFEALSLFTFGFAWLIKGRAFGDEGTTGAKLYREHNTKTEQ